MLKRRMTSSLSVALLVGISACAPVGNFCDVVSGPILFPEAVAGVVVTEARREAERLDVQNRYGAANCGW